MGRRRARPRIGATAITGAALLGAAAVHAAQIGSHAAEWAPAGIFFAVLAAAQAVVGVRVVTRVHVTTAAVAAVTLVPIGVWFISRTYGLPVGTGGGGPEAVGVADAVAVVLEMVAFGRHVLRGGGPSRASWDLAGTGVVAVLTALALVVPADHHHGAHDHHTPPATEMDPAEYLRLHGEHDHDGHRQRPASTASMRSST